MGFRLVQFVFLAEVKQKFPRLLKRSTHVNEVSYERCLTAKDNTLRQGFIDSVDRLFLLFLFIVEQSVELLHQA